MDRNRDPETFGYRIKAVYELHWRRNASTFQEVDDWFAAALGVKPRSVTNWRFGTKISAPVWYCLESMERRVSNPQDPEALLWTVQRLKQEFRSTALHLARQLDEMENELVAVVGYSPSAETAKEGVALTGHAP